MTKVLSPSKIRRNIRDAKIVSLAEKFNGRYSTIMDMHIAIAKRVGCSHITVRNVLKKAGL